MNEGKLMIYYTCISSLFSRFIAFVFRVRFMRFDEVPSTRLEFVDAQLALWMVYAIYGEIFSCDICKYAGTSRIQPIYIYRYLMYMYPKCD